MKKAENIIRISVEKASPRQLNWLVARLEGFSDIDYWPQTGSLTSKRPNGETLTHDFATNGHKILEIFNREGITTVRERLPDGVWLGSLLVRDLNYCAIGPDLQTAGLRCYCLARYGRYASVPEALA